MIALVFIEKHKATYGVVSPLFLARNIAVYMSPMPISKTASAFPHISTTCPTVLNYPYKIFQIHNQTSPCLGATTSKFIAELSW